MPLTDEFKDEELKTVAEGFTEMGVKPNLQSKEKFQKWLLYFSTGAKPKSDGATASASTQDKSPNTYQTPRLPNLSGMEIKKEMQPLICGSMKLNIYTRTSTQMPQ